MDGEFRIPAAVQRSTGALVKAADVARGAACDCYCPGCDSAVYAWQPIKSARRAHFVHVKGKACSPETWLHETAKRILSTERKLWLPSRPGKRGYCCEFDTGEEEVSIGNFAIDVVLKKSGFPLHVEIVVTHEPGFAKESWFADSHLHAVRVDLSSLRRESEVEEIRNALTTAVGLITWIYPRSVTAADSAAAVPEARNWGPARLGKVSWEKQGRTGRLAGLVWGCPLEKRARDGAFFAYATTDCYNCDARDPNQRMSQWHPKRVACRAGVFSSPPPQLKLPLRNNF